MKENESKSKEVNTESQMNPIVIFLGGSSGGPIALQRKKQILGSDDNLHKGPFIPSFDPFSSDIYYASYIQQLKF